MQDGAVLCDVDPFTPEHGVDPRSQAGFLCQLQEELESFVGDAILRVIEEDTRSLARHPLATLGIIGEQFPEMQFSDLLMVGFECLPGRAQVDRLKNRRHTRTPLVACCFSRSAILEAITTMSSSQD